MKTLYLLRHAKSSWKDKTLKDFDRPLNKRGREAAKLMAGYLREQDIRPPAQILCSPARRTQETLERMEKWLEAAIPVRFERSIYEAQASALLGRLQQLSDSLPSVMVVGHNPGIEQLCLMLTPEGDGEARDQLAQKFPSGSLAMLSADIDEWQQLSPGSAHIDSFIRPKDLGGE